MKNWPNAYKNDGTKCPKCGSTEGTFKMNPARDDRWYACDNCGENFTAEPPVQRHDEDGKPYLAYYRNDLTLGFVWSGKSGDEVQVTREMGEPIIATFPVTLTTWPTPDLFKDVCERWIEENTTNQLFGIPIRRALIITAKEE